ncbi:LURP-one-related_family protein [Hexamita inflata]|uniref:LURP-one-related_family protein n=1 Tax=Hexamita inflata TaxID=28002 RepID=A0ABP1LSZ8_9EUKA
MILKDILLYILDLFCRKFVFTSIILRFINFKLLIFKVNNYIYQEYSTYCNLNILCYLILYVQKLDTFLVQILNIFLYLLLLINGLIFAKLISTPYMMTQKFYMQEKVFGILTEFFIKNEQGQDCFIVSSKLFSLAQKHSSLDAHSRVELLSVENKLFSWSPIFYVNQNDEQIFMIQEECSCMSQELSITGIKNWKVLGDFFEHDFQIFENGQVVAIITKAWYSWGDSYQIEVYDTQSELKNQISLGNWLVQQFEEMSHGRYELNVICTIQNIVYLLFRCVECHFKSQTFVLDFFELNVRAFNMSHHIGFEKLFLRRFFLIRYFKRFIIFSQYFQQLYRPIFKNKIYQWLAHSSSKQEISGFIQYKSGKQIVVIQVIQQYLIFSPNYVYHLLRSCYGNHLNVLVFIIYNIQHILYNYQYNYRIYNQLQVNQIIYQLMNHTTQGVCQSQPLQYVFPFEHVQDGPAQLVVQQTSLS